MKRPRRKYRIGMRGWVAVDGIQWVDLYVMRHRTCLHGHSLCLDGTEEQNRRRLAITWGFMRRAYRDRDSV